ncbi:MAG: DUF1801 domain-containing protein [Paludibacter sp.]|nr:DUF1801 domain-containing protein [Paludibacter sp.]
MAALKTQPTQTNVAEFIRTFADSEQKQKDSFELIEIMRRVTGCEPQMWGPSMIGFGKYHYKSERSRQEGDWPLVGFSPRKAAISLYVFSGMPEHEYLLENLGKFKKGAACIYVKRLSDINIPVLKEIMKTTISFLKERYG